jgi:branched-chain amino acid transport system permease protein
VEIYLQLIVFGLVWGGLYALTASGLNLVVGVMKILNIAHGELLMLGAYTAFWAFTLWGVHPIVSVLLTAPLLAVVGFLIHAVVVRPIVRVSPTVERLERSTLIGFFGVVIVIQNSALLLWTADYRVVNVLQTPVPVLNVSAARVTVFGIALGVVLALYVLLMRTRFGAAIRAVSQDRDMAAMLAIDVGRIGLLAFGLGAALAGIGGALASMIYITTPTMGLIFTLKAFTVMVVGGLGSILGMIGAGLLLGVAEELGALWVGEAYKDVIGYAILITVILLISYGVVRRREIA